MINIELIYISTQSSIKNAINVIDKGAVQLALVVDEDHKLIATVSDGDIRRGLLNGISLESSVAKLLVPSNL